MKKTLILILILACLPMVAQAQFTARGGSFAPDSIGVDLNDGNLWNQYLYPAYLREGSNVIFTVVGDTLTIAATSGGMAWNWSDSSGHGPDTTVYSDTASYADTSAYALALDDSTAVLWIALSDTVWMCLGHISDSLWAHLDDSTAILWVALSDTSWARLGAIGDSLWAHLDDSTAILWAALTDTAWLIRQAISDSIWAHLGDSTASLWIALSDTAWMVKAAAGDSARDAAGDSVAAHWAIFTAGEDASEADIFDSLTAHWVAFVSGSDPGSPIHDSLDAHWTIFTAGEDGSEIDIGDSLAAHWSDFMHDADKSDIGDSIANHWAAFTSGGDPGAAIHESLYVNSPGFLDATSTFDSTDIIDGSLSMSADLHAFSSADLAGKVTGETGTGSLVFSIIPTFTDQLILHREDDTPATGPLFDLRRERDGTPTQDVSSGDYLGSLRWRGYHTDGYYESAIIQSIVDATPGSGDMPGRLEFLTSADGSGTPTLRMAIDRNGAIYKGAIAADSTLITVHYFATSQTNCAVSESTAAAAILADSCSKYDTTNTVTYTEVRTEIKNGAELKAKLDSTLVINEEVVQDVAGGMATGNTETGITVTYQDGDGTIDYEVTLGTSIDTLEAVTVQWDQYVKNHQTTGGTGTSNADSIKHIPVQDTTGNIGDCYGPIFNQTSGVMEWSEFWLTPVTDPADNQLLKVDTDGDTMYWADDSDHYPGDSVYTLWTAKLEKTSFDDSISSTTAKIPTASQADKADSALAFTHQGIKPWHTDSTAANFAFDGAYHITTGAADSAYVSRKEMRSRPQVKAFVIANIDDTYDMVLWKLPAAITIDSVFGKCKDGTNVIGALDEYDYAGASVDAVVDGDWTITTTQYVDGAFSNAGLDKGDWLGWHTTSVSGTVTMFSLTVWYHE